MNVEEYKGVVDGGGAREVLSGIGNKAGVDMVPPELVIEVGRVLDHGAKKYARGNWKRGMKWRAGCYGSILRHLFAWALGEDNDKDSGLPHLAHAACSIAFLLHYAARPEYKQFDDREKEMIDDAPKAKIPTGVAIGGAYPGTLFNAVEQADGAGTRHLTRWGIREDQPACG
jgi:hypothetical protein